MSKTLAILVFILSIDIILILGSVSVHMINPEADNFFNYENSMVSKYDSGGYSMNQSYTDYLPADEGSVTGTGNIFTDTYKSARSWISAGNTALNVVGILFFGPAVYLNPVLGQELALVTFLVGVMWFLTTLFVLVSWILGRT